MRCPEWTPQKRTLKIQTSTDTHTPAGTPLGGGRGPRVLFCCFILSAASNNGTESLMTAQAEAGNKPR